MGHPIIIQKLMNKINTEYELTTYSIADITAKAVIFKSGQLFLTQAKNDFIRCFFLSSFTNDFNVTYG